MALPPRPPGMYGLEGYASFQTSLSKTSEQHKLALSPTGP